MEDESMHGQQVHKYLKYIEFKSSADLKNFDLKKRKKMRMLNSFRFWSLYDKYNNQPSSFDSLSYF